MVIYWLPIFLAFILSIIHYFSEIVSVKAEKYHNKIISISAGIFLTLIFLEIMPELLNLSLMPAQTIFFFILLGFIIFHISEKYLYQHAKKKKAVAYSFFLVETFHIAVYG